MKVILVYPSALDGGYYEVSTLKRCPTRPPLGILSLAAIFLQNGHTVEIIDNELHEYSNKELADLILATSSDIVGFSTTFKNMSNAIEVAAMVKKNNKKNIIIFGGPQATYCADEIIKYPFIDVIVLGEGELPLRQMLKNNFSNMQDIPNIIYRGKDNEILKTKNALVLTDIDSWPSSAWQLVDFNAYLKKYPSITPFTISSSRGCPYRCNFCALPKLEKKYRRRDAVKVVEEIVSLHKKYGASSFNFVDENFAFMKDKVYELCDEIIQRKIPIRWSCNTRVDNVDKNLLKVMKTAGCKTIFFGVESASQKMLDFLKKDITIAQIKQAFALCEEVQIKTFASFMVGIPGETSADIFNSFDFMCLLNPDQYSFQTFVAIPGSQIYEYVKKNRFYSCEWETAFIVSTPWLTHTEMVKIEKEIAFRSKFYKIIRACGLKFPPGNIDYHYDKKQYENVKVLFDCFSKFMQNHEIPQAIESLNGVVDELKEVDNVGRVIKKAAYLTLVIIYKKLKNIAQAEKYQELANQI